MKRVGTSYMRHYPPLLLFRQDIYEIVELLREHFTTVTMRFGNYELDDICELEDIKETTLRECTFEARGDSGYLFLYMNPDMECDGLDIALFTVGRSASRSRD